MAKIKTMNRFCNSIILCCMFCSIGCSQQSNKFSDNQYILDFNKEFVGVDNYNEISDSINNYFAFLSKHGLRLFRHIDGNERKYLVSPIIAFNSKKNRLAGTIIFDRCDESDVKYCINYCTYFGYKYSNEWFFFISGGMSSCSKEYLLKTTGSEKLENELIFNLADELLNGAVIKDSEQLNPNDQWFEAMLENNGFYSYKELEEGMTKEDYKNAPDEFWTLKYHNALESTRMKIDSIRNSK